MSNPCKLRQSEVNNGVQGVCRACGYSYHEHTPDNLSSPHLDELREKLRRDIGFFKHTFKYYDYIEAPEGTLGGKYPSPRAIEELDSFMDRIMPTISHHLEQERVRVHNELTDNERKVWLYREDLENRLLKARIDEANNLHRRIKSGEFGNNLYGDLIRVREKLRKRVNYLRKERRELKAQLTTNKSKEK